ncbi:MAG TPA: hypothetical protein VE090_01110 [Methylomirabilota bacterium]|nr:hypothetical protein [Methylomirabilota bacterium]
MIRYLLLPFIFLKFWYIEAPLALLVFFASFNHAFFELFSLPLFLRTFFKPLKNEYRQGLVGFSRAMGMFIKSIFIIVDLVILFVLLAIEIIVLVSFLIFPIATVLLLRY